MHRVLMSRNSGFEQRGDIDRTVDERQAVIVHGVMTPLRRRHVVDDRWKTTLSHINTRAVHGRERSR